MTDARPSDSAPILADREALRRRADDLQASAEALGRAYDRTVWIKYWLYFAPVPFFVCLFRLQMEAWHYYLAGGLFVGMAVMILAFDARGLSRCDAARRAAEEARQNCDAADAPPCPSA